MTVDIVFPLSRMVLVWLAVILAPGVVAGEESLSGEQIYRQKCASCHGDSGEGKTEHYGKPLAGDRSLADLAKVIAETMPEDEPEACVGEDAGRVAAYVYDSFYSKAAQARNARPRIQLSRLTVRQYQNAVADLIGSFATPGDWNEERGLRGEYYDSKNFRRGNRALERRDAAVQFGFGESSPVPEKIQPQEFAIRWQGAVMAPETGEYEFIVKTENAARLWVNDNQRPLIDAWVKSGDETEYRESIRLLGGRAYPLRLEFFKSKDAKEKTASIALMWQPPEQVDQVIPQRNLSPGQSPETFVVKTPFPPDDRSFGYERGTSISEAWEEATTYAALETATYVVANARKMAGGDDEGQLRAFCEQFAQRAFRRPLTDEQKQFFVGQRFDSTDDWETAVKQVVLLVLKSPRFLYPGVGGSASDQYDVASRLSLGLWDSIPDFQLLAAAEKGELGTADQVSQQAQRMISDPRTRSKLREFFHQWLKVDQIRDLSKDSALYPEFDQALAADLRTSLELFLEDVIWSEGSDFRQLLLADYLYLNGRLAPLYGADLPADAPFQKVSLDPQQRAGIVSHPFLMTGFAYHSTSSPIHRGVFIARSLLGRSLRPPPQAVAPLSPELHAGLTTRERVTLQTDPMSCKVCHGMINPLGFSLEHYDALGRYRIEELGRPVDSQGTYETLAGDTVEFDGVRQLASFLADSEETHAAFVQQLFHYFVKQPILAFGGDQPDRLRQSFTQHNYNIRRLLVDLITAVALTRNEAQSD